MENFDWKAFYDRCDQFINEWSKDPERCALDSIYLKASKNEKSFLRKQKDFMPEPFLGCPEKCSVVMLNLNPADPMDKFRIDKGYAKQIIDDGYSNRAKDWTIFEKNDGGSIWWSKREIWLNRILGNQDASLKPFVIDICPWHSKKWGKLDYQNSVLVETIKANVLEPAFSAVQNAQLRTCVIAIGKDYFDILLKLGFKEEVKFSPSGKSLKVYIENVEDSQRSKNWAKTEYWPRNNKQELSNRVFAVLRKGENRILCIWSNKGGSNKPPQEKFDTLVRALIEGNY